MDHLTSNKKIKQESISLKTNSSILETYFAVKKLQKERAELSFPNSISDCDKLSIKSVYRPRAERGKKPINKRPKSIARENEIKDSTSSCSYNKEDERQIKLLNYEVESKPLEIKYSWQDLENWIPPSAKNNLKEKKEEEDEKKFACEIKYSWQIIGISSQTSDTLLEDIDFDEKKCECEIKYSWQIIGKKTQCLMESLWNSDQEKKMNGFENDANDELNSTLTDESQLFKIRNYDTKSEHPSEKSRGEELLFRYSSAQEKIHEYEKSSNEISEACSEIDSLPRVLIRTEQTSDGIDKNIYNVISYIQEYIHKLEDEFKDLDEADNQIVKRTQSVQEEIESSYEDLLANIAQVIIQKKNRLKLEAQVFENESLVPLKACRHEIKSQILKRKHLIRQIESKLGNKNCLQDTKLEELLAESRNIGGIPAVPSLDELPYFNFKRPPCKQITELLDTAYELGSIVRLGPVQIIEVEEKPACVYVKWDIVDPEYASEEQVFILQQAVGELYDSTSDEFKTVYEGSDNSCFVRNLELNQPVTLRVGIQSLESAWSAPRVAETKTPNYGWTLQNKDYMVTNNSRIAAKLVDRISTLFSQGAQLDANQIIEFKFLDVPKNGSNDEGIALLIEPQGSQDLLKRQGSLFITSQGKIFMDGEEKLMKFPRVQAGFTIIFTILRRDDETLRVNIECDEKAVTYDWCIETPLYFAARLSGISKWNLMVK